MAILATPRGKLVAGAVMLTGTTTDNKVGSNVPPGEAARFISASRAIGKSGYVSIVPGQQHREIS
jgi:hypothetical protein